MTNADHYIQSILLALKTMENEQKEFDKDELEIMRSIDEILWTLIDQESEE